MADRAGAVHVATTRRTYNGKVYETFLLRRSYRENGKVKHETLGNISHLPPETIHLIRESLAGRTFLAADDAFDIERSLPHGHVKAILGTIQKLGLGTLISSTPSRERDLVVAMIAQRLINPASKLANTRDWKNTSLGALAGVDQAQAQELYQAMDWLVARQDRIEAKLAKRYLSEGSLALYDVSSSYYEGENCALAHYGHDRDGKQGRPIIVYGLLTDEQGRPVSVSVYPGNTADPITVPDQVGKLRTRFKLKRVVMVGDRGMLTNPQIKEIAKHEGLGWISALKGRAIRSLVDHGSFQMSLFDQQNLVEVITAEYPGERLVFCFNPLLADRRKGERQRLLERTALDLDKIKAEAARRTATKLSDAAIGVKVGKVITRHKMGKHIDYKIKDGALEWSLKPQSIQREAELDGIYVIRTSESKGALTAADVVRKYKGLAQVEQAFRCLKGPDLSIRPIRHWNEDHVRAHIFICMLAYYVYWHMKTALAPLLFADENLSADRQQRDPINPAESSDQAKRKKTTLVSGDGFEINTFASLMQNLATITLNYCVVKGDPSRPQFVKQTQSTPFQNKAFELLGV
jgi:transposase